MKSKKGVGSNFILAFPTKVCAEINTFTRNVDLGDQTYQFKGKTFLLLDDIIENCFLMQEFLQRHGINSVIADNGKSALEQYKQNPRKFDMLITDLRMPEMSGQTFILEVRKYEAENNKPSVPIIVVTAENSIEEKKLCLAKYGANEYLVKPIKYQDLLLAIEKIYLHPAKENIKNVFILDDDIISARFLLATLEKNGHKCVIKNTVEEAKRYFKEHGEESDLVLVDNLLDDGTGVELVGFID